MKKYLIILIVSITLVSGCKRNDDVSPRPLENDPWQRYEDGSPGVVDLRINEIVEAKNND